VTVPTLPRAVAEGSPTPGSDARRARRTPTTWRLPIALIALGAIPIAFGTLRVIGLLGGPEVMPHRTRFDSSPAPVILHIVSAVLYIVFGAFQFSAGLRRRRPAWHRRTGRLLVPLGLVVAFSALWMNQFYVHPEGRNELLHLFRLIAGSAMAGSIVVGLVAVRRRDFRTHRIWMVRAYAIGLGAGTQAFTLGIGQGILGTTELTTALFNLAGWVINLAIAEWAIRRQG
jgi:uncharacterized membrane protein